MTLPVIILGGGGHAKVVIDALILTSVKIVGIVDRDTSKHGTTILGIPVIGTDDVVLQHRPDSIHLVNGIGSIHQPVLRRELFNTFKSRGFSFASVIHPSAIIASDVHLAEGVQVMAGAVIQAGSRIGSNSIVNTMSSVDHDCIIGDHVHLAPGVVLSGTVRIEDGVHVGTHATVIQGIRIGAGAVIGAGSLVVKDVPEKVMVAGVPGKVIER